jgi:hypothetical protein
MSSSILTSVRNAILIGLIALSLAACSQPAPTVGEAQDFATACDKVNDGKRVAVEGYLTFPESISGDQSVILRMYEADDYSGTPIGVEIEFGDQANQVEMVSDQYTDEDLKVHLADGQVAAFGTKVKVSGKVYFPIVSQNFDCGLSNPLVELAP